MISKMHERIRYPKEVFIPVWQEKETLITLTSQRSVQHYSNSCPDVKR